MTIRVLLLADTHLGFDFPSRPRVERRRRGPDFFANTRLALEPALRGEVDLVVHGGDLLFRSKVGAGLVAAALEPLLEVADTGMPVFLVPGNHERSALPYPLLATHEHLHIFDRPRSFNFLVGKTTISISGFPCERKGIRGRFADLVNQSSALDSTADIRLLCLHQTFEGARVKGYTFRGGDDVVPGRDIPSGFAAVLSGHIHRAQVLTHDLGGLPLAAPVVYPGSIERTSFAEREETKGYFILDLDPDAATGGRLERTEFSELPARPMFVITIDATGLPPEALRQQILNELGKIPATGVVQLAVDGVLSSEASEEIRAARLRELHPPEMTVELRYRRERR